MSVSFSASQSDAIVSSLAASSDSLRNIAENTKAMPLQLQIAMHLLASSIQGKGVESLHGIRGDHIDHAMSVGSSMVRSELRNAQD